MALSDARDSLFASRTSEPQWLVERGQPEGVDPPEWHSRHGWTPAAYEAWMFPTKDEAEAWIERNGLQARATEHLFIERAEP